MLVRWTGQSLKRNNKETKHAEERNVFFPCVLYTVPCMSEEILFLTQNNSLVIILACSHSYRPCFVLKEVQ